MVGKVLPSEVREIMISSQRGKQMPKPSEGKLMSLLPERVKTVLARVQGRLTSSPVGARLLGYHARRENLQNYWRHPQDDWNLPQRYLNERASRQFIVEIVRRYANANWTVFEIGCNAGANLDRLFRAGFTRLGGIEINPEAVKLLSETFPELASQVEIYDAAVEEVIQTIPDDAFDIIFTMAVLEHIHRDSEWTFQEMARIARRYLITIEDEKSSGWGHFPRNYRKVFERLGLAQVESMNCRSIEGLGDRFVARVFEKRPRLVGP